MVNPVASRGKQALSDSVRITPTAATFYAAAVVTLRFLQLKRLTRAPQFSAASFDPAQLERLATAVDAWFRVLDPAVYACISPQDEDDDGGGAAAGARGGSAAAAAGDEVSDAGASATAFLRQLGLVEPTEVQRSAVAAAARSPANTGRILRAGGAGSAVSAESIAQAARALAASGVKRRNKQMRGAAS